jgi:hypothetical protein
MQCTSLYNSCQCPVQANRRHISYIFIYVRCYATWRSCKHVTHEYVAKYNISSAWSLQFSFKYLYKCVLTLNAIAEDEWERKSSSYVCVNLAGVWIQYCEATMKSVTILNNFIGNYHNATPVALVHSTQTCCGRWTVALSISLPEDEGSLSPKYYYYNVIF